ncbi:MAG TPA: oxygenase MpaB family protein [Acidimicrobiales bacterium]|nr:oxygenase MpaB family protein [Acidimicrobiales bacterium]
MEPMFLPDSVIRRVNEEPVILFGAGRALLLQLAHPRVAAGVAEHSDFQSNPFKRLQGTLEATYTMVCGDRVLADGVGRRIRWIHDFVTGPAYQANDPANLLWVHATLLDTALGCYERLVAPLSPGDRETYYEEMAVVAEGFGCPRSAQPATVAEFEAYFAEQVRTIEVTDVGRRLASDVVRPTLPLGLHVPLGPALALQRLLAVGTLPPRLREQFGFTWDDRKQRRLDRFDALTRRTVRVLPRPARIAPINVYGRLLLHQAAKHVRQFDERQSIGAQVAS